MKVTEEAMDKLYWIQESMIDAKKLYQMKIYDKEMYSDIMMIHKQALRNLMNDIMKGREATEFKD